MNINELLKRFDSAKPSGHNQWRALCPAHADTQPSLNIREADDRILLHCFAGCSFESILEQLQLHPKDLLLRDNGHNHKRIASTNRKIVAEYDYRDADGTLLYQSIRYEPKDFNQRRPDGNGGWIWSLKDADDKMAVPLVIYRFSEVLRARETGQLVFVGEGEKDVEALRKFGLTATTNAMGSGKWRYEYSQQLVGCNVVILPDKDEAGLKHAKQVETSLLGIARTVRVIELPGENIIDVSDWIDQGGTRNELEQILTNESQSDSGPGKTVLHCMADIEAESVSWLWHPYIPRGKLTLLEGDPGVGKSWVTLSITTAISTGRGLGEMNLPMPHKVLLASAEDGLGDTIRPRLDSLGANVSNVFAIEGALTLDNDKGVATLEEYVASTEPSLVVIDPLVAYMGGRVDLHRANEVRQVMAGLARIAERYGVAILAVRHLTKGGMSKAIYRGIGSIDLTAACRSVLLAGCDPEINERRALVHIKSNLAPLGSSIGFELSEGGFFWTGESDLTAGQILSSDIEGNGLAIDEAMDFLRNELSEGPGDANQVQRGAKNAEISKRTLDRAKAKLKIKTNRHGESGKRGGGKFTWELPQNDFGCQDSIYGNDGDVNPD